ncbi:MAG: branched-chain amino acid ABC transporter permease [Saprospiraceae bacterium]|nr:branched-chain amino acid ABC transporter permease [Saprospiraceae bacterium]
MGIAIQIAANSIISGLILSLVAIGFTFIFRVTKVFHLAHGGVYVVGAYTYWWMLLKTGIWVPSVLFSFLVVAILILLFEKVVYLHLNKNQSNQSISLIASIGLYVVIVNILALFFGNENKVVENSISGSFEFGDIILTKVQVVQTVVTVGAIATFLRYLKLSKLNLALKSISDNELISKVFGVNTEKERARVFVIGSILACAAAILKTLEIGIDPQAGMGITLTAAVVGILVSRLNTSLIVLFSILLTFLQNIIEWFLNAQWRDGITFLILLLVILFRTEGIINYNLRKDRV